MNKRFLFKDYCPYLEKTHSIAINYASINLLGSKKTHYKITGYVCDYADDCPYPAEDKYGRCPVFLSAPTEPF